MVAIYFVIYATLWKDKLTLEIFKLKCCFWLQLSCDNLFFISIYLFKLNESFQGGKHEMTEMLFDDLRQQIRQTESR